MNRPASRAINTMYFAIIACEIERSVPKSKVKRCRSEGKYKDTTPTAGVTSSIEISPGKKAFAAWALARQAAARTVGGRPTVATTAAGGTWAPRTAVIAQPYARERLDWREALADLGA